MGTLDDLFNTALAPLANNTDPTKGSALVGHEGDNVKDMLDQLNTKLTNARTVQVISATSVGQSVFPVPLGYPVNLIDVTLMGLSLANGVDYSATDGLNITLVAGLAAKVVVGNNLKVEAFGSFAVANAIAASTLGASGGAALVGYGAQTVSQALDAINKGTATSAGTLTGAEILPVSRGAGLLDTTLNSVGTFQNTVFPFNPLSSIIGTVARTPSSYLTDVPISAKWFGAAGNLLTVSHGTMTAGSPTLFATATFTAADVGKAVVVSGAGAAGANLVTTISAYVASNQVTLAANAGTSLSTASVTYGTDDTAALQAWITYLIVNGRKGVLPAANYLISGQLNFSTRPGWSIEGEHWQNTTITQITDNTPIFYLGSDTASLMWGHAIREMTLTYANFQPATNTSANQIYFNTMAYEGEYKRLIFNNGYYGMMVATGIGCPWGSVFDQFVVQGGSGGAMNWTNGSNATPNNHFGRMEISCNNMVGPIFSVRGYNFSVDVIEFLNANQSPVLWQLAAGSQCIAQSMKVEVFNYTSAATMFNIQANGNFKLGSFTVAGSTPSTINPSSGQVVVFAMGTSSPGNAAGIRVGYVSLNCATAVVNGFACGASAGGPIVIDDFYASSGWLLNNAGSSVTADFIKVSSYVSGSMSENLGDANYTASAGISPNILVFTTAFTAPRTITLPSNTSQFHNGVWFEMVFYGAINGSNTVTIGTSSTTILVQSTDKVVIRFTFARTLGWVMTKYETLPTYTTGVT